MAVLLTKLTHNSNMDCIKFCNKSEAYRLTS